MFLRRGQGSTELFPLLGIVLAILIAAVAIGGELDQRNAELKELVHDTRVCNDISSLLNAVYSAGDGMEASLSWERNGSINPQDYRLTRDTVSCQLMATKFYKSGYLNESTIVIPKEYDVQYKQGVLWIVES